MVSDVFRRIALTLFFVSIVQVISAQDDHSKLKWLQPVVVANDEGGFNVPTLAFDGKVWVAVWYSDDDNSAIYVSASLDEKGEKWGTPVLLASSATPSIGEVNWGPFIKCSHKGLCIVTWNSNYKGTINTDVLFSYSKDHGVSWSSPKRIMEENAELETDHNGVWMAVFYTNHAQAADSKNDTYDIVHSILHETADNENLAWGPTKPIVTVVGHFESDAHDFTPTIATDRLGNYVVAWVRDLDGRYGIYSTMSHDNGETWMSPVEIILSGNGIQHLDPSLTTDGKGRWMVVWHTNLWTGTTGQRDIAFSYTTSYGHHWGPPGRVMHHLNIQEKIGVRKFPRLESDRSGHWMCFWYQEPTKDEKGEVMWAYSHYDDANIKNPPEWVSMGPVSLVESGIPVAEEYPSLTTDEMGRWISVWKLNETQLVSSRIQIPTYPPPPSTSNKLNISLPSCQEGTKYAPFVCRNGVWWTPKSVNIIKETVFGQPGHYMVGEDLIITRGSLLRLIPGTRISILGNLKIEKGAHVVAYHSALYLTVHKCVTIEGGTFNLEWDNPMKPQDQFIIGSLNECVTGLFSAYNINYTRDPCIRAQMESEHIERLDTGDWFKLRINATDVCDNTTPTSTSPSTPEKKVPPGVYGVLAILGFVLVVLLLWGGRKYYFKRKLNQAHLTHSRYLDAEKKLISEEDIL